MKKIFKILLSIFFSLSLYSYGQNPDLSWAKHWGSPELDAGASITIDVSDNIYTMGFFRGTVDFDPGAGVFEMTALGDNNGFISKLDANGNFIWARHIKGKCINPIVTTDQIGNVYISCYFNNSIEFSDNTSTISFSSTAYDVFFAKLDPNGNILWGKKIGSTYSYTRTGFLSVASNGSVYISGTFDDITDFNPGTNTYYLTPNTNETDAFICKLNSNGDFIWAKQFGNLDPHVGGALGTIVSTTTDINENLYIIGNFYNTVDFDPGTNVHNLTSNGNQDIFILKLDMNGNFIWAKSIGGVSDEHARSISINPMGNLCITGEFRESVDFDPGNNTFNMTTINQIGSVDVFILMLDTNGEFIWAKQLGVNNAIDNSSYITTRSTTFDIQGNAYNMGYFSGTVDFNPSINGVFEMNSINFMSLYISKFDVNGNFVWATKFGNEYSGFTAEVGDIKIDSNGSIFINGGFGGTVDFDPGNSTYNLTSNSYYLDAFVIKLVQTGIIGIDNVENQNESYLFPNPNTGIFYFLNDLLNDVTKLNIYTLTGKLIYSTNGLKPHINCIDISSQPSGIYLLEFQSGAINLHKKIIKN